MQRLRELAKNDSKMSLILLEQSHKDCSPEQRSGHVAVLFKGLMFVYGGYNEVYINSHRHDRFMPSDEIWIFDSEVFRWSKVKTTGDHPASGISGATACIFNNSIIIFGGFGDVHGRLSLVFELNLNTLTWRNLTMEGAIKGLPPSKRDKVVSWQHQNRIIYFGGFGPPPKKDQNGYNGEFCFDQGPWGDFEGIGWNSDVCVLEFSDSGEISWQYPEIDEEWPAPRAAHAGCKIINHGYVFGGRHEFSRVNDMYYLDLDTYKWHKVKYNSSAPAGRSWHILQKLSDHQLLIYGGLDADGLPLSDMWIFNIKIGVWSEIENVFDRLNGHKATRIWHTAVASDTEGEVVIFGGCSNSVLSEEPSFHCNNIIIFRWNPLPLERLCVNEVAKLLPKLREENRFIPKHVEKRIRKHLDLLVLDSAHQTPQCNMVCTVI